MTPGPKKKKGVSKKSIANLIPVKKGEIRNPKGRPKGPCIASALKRALADGNTVDAVAKDWVENSRMPVGGAFARIIADRVDGPLQQRVDVTSKGEKVKAYVGWSPEEWAALATDNDAAGEEAASDNDEGAVSTGQGDQGPVAEESPE